MWGDGFSLAHDCCQYAWLHFGWLFVAVLYVKLPHPRWINLFYWGFIGGFTAFSSFIKEGMHFFLHGEHITGFLYIFLQNMLGMFAAGAAFWLGKMLL
ncbi:CrcB family protein [Acidaminococcus intestini]|nr:CrcB family protein [Acidaminococcus intestini]